MPLRIGLASAESPNLPRVLHELLAACAVLALADDLQVAGSVVGAVAVDVVHHPVSWVSYGESHLAVHGQLRTGEVYCDSLTLDFYCALKSRTLCPSFFAIGDLVIFRVDHHWVAYLSEPAVVQSSVEGQWSVELDVQRVVVEHSVPCRHGPQQLPVVSRQSSCDVVRHCFFHLSSGFR